MLNGTPRNTSALRWYSWHESRARRKSHLVHFGRIPCRHNEPAGIRIAPDHFYHIRELVYAPSVWGRPAAPLVPVHRAEVSVFISPFVPDAHAMVLEVFYVGVPCYEPQEFIDDGLEMHFLGGQKRKSVREIESHLIAEDTLRAYARPVLFHHPVPADMPQKVKILFHSEDIVHSDTLNAKIIASSNTSPGLRTVEGYSGLFGESGKCWHSMATPS